MFITVIFVSFMSFTKKQHSTLATTSHYRNAIFEIQEFKTYVSYFYISLYTNIIIFSSECIFDHVSIQSLWTKDYSALRTFQANVGESNLLLIKFSIFFFSLRLRNIYIRSIVKNISMKYADKDGVVWLTLYCGCEI